MSVTVLRESAYGKFSKGLSGPDTLLTLRSQLVGILPIFGASVIRFLNNLLLKRAIFSMVTFW
jgi:hypothetical protein